MSDDPRPKLIQPPPGNAPEPIKPYYRIGEVSQIVGVQPHVLRYWETEFSSIRPSKSSKGQRVYSRRDVQRLLQVKDLLRNQGFSIAGAKRRLRELEKTSDWLVSAEALSNSPSSSDAKAMRRALVAVRRELHSWLNELRRER